MLRLVAVLLAALALGGCLGPRIYQPADAPRFAKTQPESIVVLEEVPPGAVELGVVEGVGGGWGMIFHPDALSNALDGAAELGADAVVVIGQGEETLQADLWARETPTVRVKALRLAPGQGLE